jgi:hypothetical protein
VLRKTILLTNVVAACLWVFGTGITQAQQKQKVEVRVGDQPAPPSPPGQLFRAKEILGGKVTIEGNISIGRVEDFVVDQDGYIEYLIVGNDGKLVTVPWDAAKFNFQERSAFVGITQEQFRKVPIYTAEKYPVYTAPMYRTEIYRFYNLTPRERRLERRLDRQK